MSKMPLNVYVSFALSTTVTQGEAAHAAGYATRWAFITKDREGKLTLDRIHKACEVFGLDPIDAAVIMGYMEPPTVDWQPSGKGIDGEGALRLTRGYQLRENGRINHAHPV